MAAPRSARETRSCRTSMTRPMRARMRSTEDLRRNTASEYSALLDAMMYQYVLQLRQQHPDVTIDCVSFNDAAESIIARLDQIFSPEMLASYDNPSDVLFFDQVHPTAQ